VQPRRLVNGIVLIPVFAFLIAWGAAPAASQGTQDAATAKKPADPKSTGKAASTAKPPAKSTTHQASTGTTKKTTSTRKHSSSSSKSASKRAPKQQQPEPGRIREIQLALTEHGYPVETNGVWDASTVEALKRFQADQNIENLSGRGKLDSLTLIALGLGPKRETPAGSSEAPQRSPEGHFP